MRKCLWIVVALLIGTCARTAKADSVTFHVSGTFEDGGTLAGSITIDTTAGIVDAVDLTTTSIGFSGSPYTDIGLVSLFEGFIDIVSVNSNPITLNSDVIALVLPTASLIGYNGGPICSVLTAETLCPYMDQPAVSIEESVSGLSLTELESGTLTPLTATPEPGTIILMLVGLGAMAVKRNRKA